MSEHDTATHAHPICPLWLAGMLESPLRKALHKPEKPQKQQNLGRTLPKNHGT